MGKVTTIGDVIGALRGSLAPSITASIITPVWRLVVGEAIFNHCVPTSWRGGKLVVTCSSGVWSAALKESESQIVEKIQTHLKSKIITGIDTRIKAIERKQAGKITKPKTEKIPITHERMATVEVASENVPTEIKELFQRAYMAQIASGHTTHPGDIKEGM
ncbi:MAG TPA: DUF721 domain-containing protein [Caldisericia bacterium]|nr:DUF721 domain-containing protein [Caldisericia bacterium]HPF49473.1 DUF721 domain-containing protein [Caldisericia bacterium]HPI84233.1 DUF721 domain-containing protein [Caldisericia bacterium]HPQ93472.1 DUF721 domain-containing protein [Caldisericia bacterium]HRV75522.1 DUF721 domain-containing protein [Caldisericia bacterium]